MRHEAIILAGGMGTRLKEKVIDLPKPMAPINDRPFLEYLLDYLFNQGITRVILSVGYKYEIIQNYFGNRYKNAKLIYAIETMPLGTGGAISLSLQKCESQHIFIVNGDTFFPIHLQKLFEAHVELKAETTLALKQISPADRYGTVKIDDRSIVLSFEEKGISKSGLINGGIYIMDKNKFEKRFLGEKYSFEKDYLEYVATEGCLSGEIFQDYFLDIGIPETFMRAQTELPKIQPLTD